MVLPNGIVQMCDRTRFGTEAGRDPVNRRGERPAPWLMGGEQETGVMHPPRRLASCGRAFRQFKASDQSPTARTRRLRLPVPRSWSVPRWPQR